MSSRSPSPGSDRGRSRGRDRDRDRDRGRESGASAPVHFAVDREKVCPFLLRIFSKVGAHHRDTEWRTPRQGGAGAGAGAGATHPDNEINIYTWMDASLREITDLIQEVVPEARNPNTKLHFKSVFPNQAGRYVLRDLGACFADPHVDGGDDDKTLRDVKFSVGDYIDVALFRS